MENVKAQNEKIEILQVLRMVGAAVVFLSHIYGDGITFFNGVDFWGRLGVGIFFTMSGFLLVYTDHGNFKGYIRKKLIRICPLYWLSTAAVFAIGLVSPQLLHTSVSSLPNLLRSLFFIPYASGGAIFPLNPVGWTLIIEMFVYLVYDCAAVVSIRLFKLSGDVGVVFRGAASAVFLSILAVMGRVLPENIITATYCQTYMLYFAVGIVGALLMKKFRRVLDSFWNKMSEHEKCGGGGYSCNTPFGIRVCFDCIR